MSIIYIYCYFFFSKPISLSTNLLPTDYDIIPIIETLRHNRNPDYAYPRPKAVLSPNSGTKIRKKAKFLCNFQKSLYLCTRLTALRIDSLAQQVEHNTFNVGVLGSSPKRITLKELKIKRLSKSDNRFFFIYTAFEGSDVNR